MGIEQRISTGNPREATAQHGPGVVVEVEAVAALD